MADFRRLFYALALVTLLAGLTVPASAQAPPFECTANAGVPPIVRGEGYTELTGDLTLNCTGGISTPAGQTVPQVNFTILLNTNITSKLLAGGVWSEALLIIDEPHSAVNPTVPILNCGNTGATDNGPSGAGVCAITSTGAASATYNGTPGNGTYGTGHPNVFQARLGSQVNPGQFNAVTWSGVPLDPPGTTTGRTLRFTNIRADAEFLGVSSTFTTNFVQAQISVNGNTSLAINNPQQIVAFIERGLLTSVVTATTPPGGVVSFLQCVPQNAQAFANGTGVNLSNSPQTPTFRFMEGFQSSWKAKNIAMITNQAPGNGNIAAPGQYWTYNGLNGAPTFNYPGDQNQNVPGAIYNTESGFMYPPTGVEPNPNPPQGTGTIPGGGSGVSGLGNAFSDTATGFSGAGVASQGTRLAIQLTNIPNGSTVLAPQVVFLSNNGGSNHTGVAVLTTTDANGAGAYTPPSGALSSANFVQVQSSGLIVYEVLFADPFSIETADVPIVVAFATNLASNLPAPNVTAQAAGGFAPFYGGSQTAAARQPSSTLPVPRFVPGTTPLNLYTIFKCNCDVLFPYAVSAGGYDTGIAIANTSLDPGAAFGFFGQPQSGAVQFWYYGDTVSGPPPATQCTNVSSPGTCPGTTVVPPGQVLTYVLSSGSGPWGLDNRANGFLGYIIAQAQFQYCHAFAFITALGAGPTSPAISEGYLGIILQNGSLVRVAPAAEGLLQ